MTSLPSRISLRKYRCASLLVLLGLILEMLPCHLTAGEDPLREITVRCNADQTTTGSPALTTWTLVDDPSAYRPEDIVLTQDHLDRMRLCWAPSDDGHIPSAGGIRPEVPPRTLRMSDDPVLSYPIEVILPGWAALTGNAAAEPAKTLVWWRLGGGWHTSNVPLIAPPPSSIPAATTHPILPFAVPIAYGLDATFTPQEVVTTESELIAHVSRITAPYNRAEVWRSATIEWTRLPDQASKLTTVFSPFQAGTQVTGPLTDAVAIATPLPHALRFRVADALRDPRSGTTAPGRYRIRLAMGWMAPDAQGGSKAPVLVTIRSLPQTIRVLAQGEPMPARCPICGTLIEEHRVGQEHR